MVRIGRDSNGINGSNGVTGSNGSRRKYRHRGNKEDSKEGSKGEEGSAGAIEGSHAVQSSGIRGNDTHGPRRGVGVPDVELALVGEQGNGYIS